MPAAPAPTITVRARMGWRSRAVVIDPIAQFAARARMGNRARVNIAAVASFGAIARFGNRLLTNAASDIPATVSGAAAIRFALRGQAAVIDSTTHRLVGRPEGDAASARRIGEGVSSRRYGEGT